MIDLERAALVARLKSMAQRLWVGSMDCAMAADELERLHRRCEILCEMYDARQQFILRQEDEISKLRAEFSRVTKANLEHMDMLNAAEAENEALHDRLHVGGAP